MSVVSHSKRQYENIGMRLLKLLSVESLFDCVTFKVMQDLRRTRQIQKREQREERQAKLVALEDVLFIAADAVPCCCWPVQTRHINTATCHTHTQTHTYTLLLLM